MAAFLPALATAGTAAGTGATIAGVSLGTIGTALSLGSTALSAIGGMQDAGASRAAYEYNARVAEQNARIAEQNTRAEVRDAERNRRLRLGANVARSGANTGGLTGSALDVLNANANDEALYLASIRAAGLNNADNARTEAQLNRMKKKNVSSGAGSTLLKGTANALTRFS